jgi:tetratricopeptide (TPR) repeat protein
MLDAVSKKKLFRLLNPKSFRCIVVLYEDSNDIKDIKSFIQKHFSLEKSTTLELANSSYSKVSQVLYDKEHTIIYIEDFRTLLQNREFYEGFNQRRDKLAKYPINLICFYPKALKRELYREALKNIPDLWEFRNGIIELPDKEKSKALFEDVKLKSNSSLGGLNYRSKEEEIIRLEEYIKSVKSKELRINILNQLGQLEYDLGKYKNALDYWEESLRTSRKVLGEEHPDTATSYGNLAGLYRSTGEYEKALPLYEKSLLIREKVLGEEHPDTATSYNNLGVFYFGQKNYIKANEYMQKAVDIQQKVLPNGHPGLQNSLAGLELIKEKLAR